MPDKVKGEDLKTGDVFKHESHNRVYEITDIEPPDYMGERLTECKTTSGEYVTFNLFHDSEYELRSKPGRPRVRMVKVRADDIELVTNTRAHGSGEELVAAMARLREAIK